MNSYKLKTPLRVKLKQQLWKAKTQLFPRTKRVCDIVISFLALAMLTPILLLTGVLIRLESRGPILFKQQRVGIDSNPFTMYKFRSMFNDASERRKQLEAENEMDKGVLFKIKHDPRITRVGKIIRKTSIDELPQLLNVLKGDMSLVGPRPPLPDEVAQYSNSDRIRLDVLPGITCLWQVSGRSDIPFDQQVKLDTQYIEKQSLSFDLLLLLKTIPAVLKGNGAY